MHLLGLSFHYGLSISRACIVCEEGNVCRKFGLPRIYRKETSNKDLSTYYGNGIKAILAEKASKSTISLSGYDVNVSSAPAIEDFAADAVQITSANRSRTTTIFIEIFCRDYVHSDICTQSSNPGQIVRFYPLIQEVL